jgi:DNA replication and repair protein RecF
MEYERIVRQRNALLKEVQRNQEVLEALTERIVIKGVAFMGHRHRLFDRVKVKMSEVYETLAPGEKLSAAYVPSWRRTDPSFGSGDPMESMRKALVKGEAEERARGLTLVGPHRDEVVFSVNEREARSFASQGQMRTIALAWKLAEVAVITDIAGQAPVLLLDDVMSELDEARRHALTSFVGGAAQTFLTTTNLGYFEEGLVARARVVSIP